MNSEMAYSWFSRDVTAAMLVYRTITKKIFWEFDSIIMQNLSDILPLFCTPACPSYHVKSLILKAEENLKFDVAAFYRMNVEFSLESANSDLREITDVRCNRSEFHNNNCIVSWKLQRQTDAKCFQRWWTNRPRIGRT